MLLLGIDLGTSSIKASVVEAETRKTLVSVQYPDTETAVLAPRPGWAEQSPETWWNHVQEAIRKANASGKYNPAEIGAIGIAYQMHGLVLVDKNRDVLRNAIIWCDSRAVPVGDRAFRKIGEKKALKHLLNSPGNFTAAKLGWVKIHEKETYKKIDAFILPGDFISYKLTGSLTTSISALSEGIFWDFRKNRLSNDVFGYFGFNPKWVPEIQPVFSIHGKLDAKVASVLSLQAGIPVSYKAGDQPNNALSLNVLEPGEVAATAGTSGVIYGVSDRLSYDRQSRVNSFAHVNHTGKKNRIGVLLCINGTGILNSWVHNHLAPSSSYASMNEEAAKSEIGSEGLRVLPFGNGAERMLGNRIIGAEFRNIDLNLHRKAHLFRGVQEGIACAFRYGLDILRENGMNPKVIRAGKANMFLSGLFVEEFVNTTGVPVELFDVDGSVGAALGAGIGAGVYRTPKEAFKHQKPLQRIKPYHKKQYEALYQSWKKCLEKELK